MPVVQLAVEIEFVATIPVPFQRVVRSDPRIKAKIVLPVAEYFKLSSPDMLFHPHNPNDIVDRAAQFSWAIPPPVQFVANNCLHSRAIDAYYIITVWHGY